MFLKQHRKTYQKSSKIRLVLVPQIGVLRGKWGKQWVLTIHLKVFNLNL